MRTPRGRALRAAVFVAVVVLVVVGSVGASIVGIDPGGPEAADYPEFDSSALVPERAAAGGVPAVDPAAEPGVVVIDRAHVNRFEPAEIQTLVEAISATGYRIDYLRSSEDLGAALSRADALLVVDPSVRYTPEEANRVESFVESGGRLVMLGEPTQASISTGAPLPTLTTRENQLGTLSNRFGIEFGSAYLYNMAESDGNYRNVFAEGSATSPVTEGVDRTSLYTATHVRAADGSPFLVATDGTRTERGDATGNFSVGVRKGDVLAIGDTTFLAGDNYNVVDNERLIGNLAVFLTSGSRTRTVADYPYLVDGDPTIAYTDAELLPAAKAVAGHFRGAGRETTLSLRRGSGAASGADVLIADYGYLARHDVGAGISASAGRVSVSGYESAVDGVVVVRAPRNGVDVVIAVDDPETARRAVSMLGGGGLGEHAIGDRTAVLRIESSSGPPAPTGNTSP